MSRLTEFVVDRWSALSHKQPMREDTASQVQNRVSGWAPHSWVGDDHRRRITAYTVLSAYDENVSRHFLQGDDDDREDRREYGDAALVIDTVLSALLGDEQAITVPGAERYDADFELDLTEEDEDGNETEREATDEELQREADNNEARILSERQEFLTRWAEDIHMELRMVDCERNAVALGDGVYLLGWDDARQRPTCAVMDPGFYFPVLPDTLDSYDYPTKVHFAWELPAEDFDDRKPRVRRITYELTELAPILDDDILEATGDVEAAFTLPPDTEWETVTENGVSYRRVVRQYPWDEKPSPMVCTMTDATWIVDELDDAHNVDAFSFENADIAVDEEGQLLRDYDLGIDFLPVVHVPNTSPGGDHFGQSTLSKLLQIVDDIQNADTDAQKAAATTGSPIIGVSGTGPAGDDPLTGRRGKPLTVAPGEVWKLGVDGRMDTLDTSPNLAATREYVSALRDRLFVNGRLPAAVIGTLTPDNVPSGYALQLSFGPLTSMIRTMRKVRAVKYRLLLKMAQRLYQANDVLPPGETVRAEYQFGSFLPTDMETVLKQVRDAYESHVISLETAVRMLLEAGFPIDDVAEEIARIEGRDFEGANELADLGDPQAAYDYLGRRRPDPEPTPQAAPLIVQPGVVPPGTVPPVVEPGAPIAGGTGTGVPSPSDSGGGTA